MEGILDMSMQDLKQVLAKKQAILQGDAGRLAGRRGVGGLGGRRWAAASPM